MIRPAKEAFNDFMDPAVLFIFASLVIGLVFNKTGLTKRMAYKMLALVGEKTTTIYLGIFVLIALLTHIMAHTGVAATVYPLLLAIYSLYGEGDKPTKFGKGLFMGMAYVCGAGSIITLLGSARAIVALGFFKEMAGTEVSFFQLTYYMAPLGWAMVFILWVYFSIVMKPEKPVIEGLRERVSELSDALGPITRNEIIALAIVGVSIVIMSLQIMIPPLRALDKSAIFLVSTILFFVLKILDIDDLELVPWNIVLLFAGASTNSLVLGSGSTSVILSTAFKISTSAGFTMTATDAAKTTTTSTYAINLKRNRPVKTDTIPRPTFASIVISPQQFDPHALR
jgi:sodium-dependent dicarboxylate transporter 2/3/5